MLTLPTTSFSTDLRPRRARPTTTIEPAWRALVVVGRALSYAPYGFMIPKNNPTMLTVANRTLARLFRSGELQTIYTKWFDQVGFPLTDDMKHSIAVQAFPE